MEMETGVSRIPVTATTAMATKVRNGYGLAARGRGCGRGAGGELLLRLLLITSKIHNTIPTSTTFAAGCAMVFFFFFFFLTKRYRVLVFHGVLSCSVAIWKMNDSNKLCSPDGTCLPDDPPGDL